jgi:hypothetical protein
MPDVNVDSFFNQFAANPQVLPALIIFSILALPIFGYFYNRLMNKLDNEHEHVSIYVALGVLVTLGVAALFSWKSALLLLSLFILDGTPMILGEFKRTEVRVAEKRSPRRKRLPYAANGRIDDATMSIHEASRLLGMALKEKDITVRALQMATASHELNAAHTKLLELKMIQQIEE